MSSQYYNLPNHLNKLKYNFILQFYKVKNSDLSFFLSQIYYDHESVLYKKKLNIWISFKYKELTIMIY
jgi:hypothetical protein